MIILTLILTDRFKLIHSNGRPGFLLQITKSMITILPKGPFQNILFSSFLFLALLYEKISLSRLLIGQLLSFLLFIQEDLVQNCRFSKLSLFDVEQQKWKSNIQMNQMKPNQTIFKVGDLFSNNDIHLW